MRRTNSKGNENRSAKRKAPLKPLLTKADTTEKVINTVRMMPAEAKGQQRTENHVTFLLNFADEVRRRMGAGKQ